MTKHLPPRLVITGGAGDLAQAINSRFSQGDWDVCAPGRQELNVIDANAVNSYFSHYVPDLLICNAGTIRDAPIAKLSLADWQHVIDVNYHGAQRCASAVLPRMLHRGSGHVIFISSYSALHPPIGQSAYASAKAALLGLTHDLAAKAGSHNVRVNAILPGFLETRMTCNITKSRRDIVRADHALGRFNTPENVASFIWHLQHELLHTSGQIFQLDSRIG